MTHSKKITELREAVDFIEDDDWTTDNTGAQCPYCGYINHVESEDRDIGYKIEKECGQCEKYFDFEVEFEISYTGYKKTQEE